MMLYHNYFHGKLNRSLLPGNVIEATPDYFILLSANDYRTRLNKESAQEPIYVNASERYMFLSEIVNLSCNHFPKADFILIKSRMPSLAKLTKSLLDEKLFLCEDVTLEKETLLTLNKQFLTIEDDFKRIPLEDSDNSLIINAYTFEDKTVEFGAIISLCEKFGVKNIEK